MRSGFVAIIGKPNAGKSTLVNSLLKEKISITSKKAQTTRNAIIGVMNREDLQIVFLDTPGIHKSESTLGDYMNKEALKQADGMDVIYYLSDVRRGFDENDDEILRSLFSYKVPVFLLLNKIDSVSKDKLLSRVLKASEKYEFKEIIPISALNEENLDELIDTTVKYFKDEMAFYPEDYVTNTSKEFRISEIIREKILERCEKEIPHLVACKVDTIKEKENKVFIEATIVCNKDSHKGIIIGRHGDMLKRINLAASKDIKNLFNKRVQLSLFVKVEEDWMNKNSKLLDLGYFIGDKYDH